jgi:hypothetical protein
MKKIWLIGFAVALIADLIGVYLRMNTGYVAKPLNSNYIDLLFFICNEGIRMILIKLLSGL